MHILVATDFSARSDRALRRAALLARELGGRITLAHVVDNDRPESVIAADRAAAGEWLSETAGTLRDVDGIEADWRVPVDDVHAGILAAADDVAADLIVVGPHRSRLRDVFVGTTVERVVRRSVRPLLVAVDSPKAQHRRTLLAMDFDDASKFAARQALAMGLFDQTSVTVMHAFDAPAAHMMKRAFEPGTEVQRYVDSEERAAMAELASLRDELALPPTSQLVAALVGSPARTIREAAREEDSDLIVLGTNQRNGFERALIGSVTADVIRDAHCDILVIPVDPAG